ncbi:hypothetical protein [Sphingomonas sp. OK281]|nr:hypothetical protein [Sphingomonas sp. OK281]
MGKKVGISRSSAYHSSTLGKRGTAFTDDGDGRGIFHDGTRQGQQP